MYSVHFGRGGEKVSGISTKIFGNDMSLDVKSDFISLYGLEKSVDEINEYIFSYKPDDDDEEACAFWTALALIEWKYGVLTDCIKNKAQHIIKNHSDASLFLNKSDEEARMIELQKLYEQISTINPTPKKRKKTFVYRTKWKEGDVFAIPLCNKYVYIHISAVDRTNEKIKELEEDCVFVKVFDCISDKVLDIQDFKPKTFQKNQYKNLDKFRVCFVKWLWCVGVREKTYLEKKVIYIGNLPIKRETTRSIYADFQFSKLENTLCELFGLL